MGGNGWVKPSVGRPDEAPGDPYALREEASCTSIDGVVTEDECRRRWVAVVTWTGIDGARMNLWAAAALVASVEVHNEAVELGNSQRHHLAWVVRTCSGFEKSIMGRVEGTYRMVSDFGRSQ